jgi:hypothetical protein
VHFQKVILERNGPILGFFPNSNCALKSEDLMWTTTVDSDRSLHCYKSYGSGGYEYSQDGWSPAFNYTKCMQVGWGWGRNTKYSNFTIVDSLNPDNISVVGNNVTMDIYTSDKIALLPNGTLPGGFNPECLSNGTVPPGIACDWETFFQASPLLSNATEYVNTIVMTLANETDAAIWTLDYVAYAAFTTYTLDPSPLSNPLWLVQTQEVPATGNATPVDPYWTLAAWSVDDGGQITTNRSTTAAVVQVLTAMLNGTLIVGGTAATAGVAYQALTNVPIMQTLSAIEYNLTNVTSTQTLAARSEHHQANDQHPLLYRTAKIYVWAYGMSSRTAYLGATVAILGIVVVLTQFVLGLIDRRRYRSPTQLLVAALEHMPRGEFHGKDDEELARVRFHVTDDEEKAGKFSFHFRERSGEKGVVVR